MEIRPPRVEEEPKVEKGVPVRLALPAFGIVDRMASRRKGQPTKQQASSNQIEPDHKPGTSPEEQTTQQPDEVQIAKQPNEQAIAPQLMDQDIAQQPGPSQDGDDVSRKRERTVRSDHDTDVDIPEAKVTKRRFETDT